MSLCKWLHREQRFVDWSGSTSVRGKLVQAASFCYFLCKQPLLPACYFTEKSRYQARQLACFARRFDLLGVSFPTNFACCAASNLIRFWVTPAFLPHTPAFSWALQLAAQDFTAASAHAPLLTLADLTATCITAAVQLNCVKLRWYLAWPPMAAFLWSLLMHLN